MKAVTYSNYGGSEELEIAEKPTPIPGPGEVLVRVHASSLNSADLDLLKGVPMVRIAGLMKPRYSVLGSDIAGRVVSVGEGVSEFSMGDEVAADLTEHGFGGWAEFALAPEKALVLIPDGVSFSQAASAASAGAVAQTHLFAKDDSWKGKKILIIGAGGGMGSFALQLAKADGAIVYGVDKGCKDSFMASLGARMTYDYEREDILGLRERFDLILDLAAYRSILDYKNLLTEEGKYRLVGGNIKALFQGLILAPLSTMNSAKEMGVIFQYPKAPKLKELLARMSEGIIKAPIDRTYSLNNIREAVDYLESGRALGKIALAVREERKEP